MGYDSESKGLRIYWPDKRSVSVERNVTFNSSDIHLLPDESVLIPDDVLDEGKKDKINRPNIAKPEKNSQTTIQTPNESIVNPDPPPKPRRSHDLVPDPPGT